MMSNQRGASFILVQPHEENFLISIFLWFGEITLRDPFLNVEVVKFPLEFILQKQINLWICQK